MASMDNMMNSILNMDTSKIIKKSGGGESEFYSPRAKDGTKNIYTSLVRFIPYVKDTEKSLILKQVVWVENVETGEKKYVDCPTSLGDKTPSLLKETYFALSGSNSAADQKMSKKWKRKTNYYAMVQILEDNHAPEMVGKIKVFQFGQQIKEKLDMISVANDLTGEKANNPFDLWAGLPLFIYVKEVSSDDGQRKFNNYTDSKFLTDPRPFLMGGKELKKDAKSVQKAVQFLIDNCPDLLKYEFRPWSEETRQFVVDTITANVPGGTLLDGIMRKAGGAVATKKAKVVTQEVDNSFSSALENIDEPDEDDDDEEEVVAPKKKKKDKKKKDKKKGKKKKNPTPPDAEEVDEPAFVPDDDDDDEEDEELDAFFA